ncbi:MAG: STAS domain-containing protein [Lactobacillus sp.]|jgi:SulP family sulfate permease|nr:STAS domain-containing protein [Lactobacillus sp.]
MFSFIKRFKEYYGLNFAPKLYEVLIEGYTKEAFKKDCMSGLTIAIISIPLAMALAIASGVSPANGLYTAIIAGFFISACGGSKYQIGGPTGAFVVVIFNVIAQYGYSGLLITMIISGIMLIIAGFLKFGSYIKYIPYPVIIGFTSGIAVLLFSTQIKDMLGLAIENVPVEVLPKWRSYFANINTINYTAVVVSIIAFAAIIGIKLKYPKLPGYLIAVIVCTIIVAVLPFDVDTIGSKFGDLPHFLPKPSVPEIHIDLILKVFPSALTLAFLAGVESLLSATVADAMSGDNHNSNAELIGEGVANIACAFFAGIPATGAIARTATNVRSGATSPVAGIMHAVFLLGFLVFLAPTAKFIPLACLSAILIMIAYGMFDQQKFFGLLFGQRGDRLTLLVTFLLTVFIDLNAAISVGFIMYSIIFMHRISGVVGAENLIEYSSKGRDLSEEMIKQGVMSIRLSGPIFFGGASKISTFFKKIDSTPKIVILRVGNVPYVDVSGINVIYDFIKKAKKHNTKIIFSNLKPQPRLVISKFLRKKRITKDITYATDFPRAVKIAARMLRQMKIGEMTTN